MPKSTFRRDNTVERARRRRNAGASTPRGGRVDAAGPTRRRRGLIGVQRSCSGALPSRIINKPAPAHNPLVSAQAAGSTSCGLSRYHFDYKLDLVAAVSAWTSDAAVAAETYGNISTWDVSAITDMSYLFHRKVSFNDDISGWDARRPSQNRLLETRP